MMLSAKVGPAKSRAAINGRARRRTGMLRSFGSG
jgi:hypothetical protein